jgi:tetratricopeptide (TPR) repeat protein
MTLAAARSETAWLDEARLQILRGEWPEARSTLERAIAEYPGSMELRRVQAAVLQQAGRTREAESLLQALLETDATDSAAAFALARILADQGRVAAATAAIRRCLVGNGNRENVDRAIAAIELLDDCDRKHDAAEVAAAALTAHPDDTRLHAYAGMLQIQLGEFEQARQHYLFALEHDERAWEWHAPIGLSSAQHYENSQHPDFALLQGGLHRDGLSEKARAELHFALGKAHDDVGDYELATRYFREGNAIARSLTTWNRKAWRRATEARLASEPFTRSATLTTDFNPIFIVGMPRSGTTLLAELLSRHPKVCNRGELPWIATLATQADLSGHPDPEVLRRAATTYVKQARRDDAVDSRWIIDKQPLNFRYVDLMLAMFPHARVIHCRRSARDTALSLWAQYFLEDVQGYAYDFGDIELVMRDCTRLMRRWTARHGDSIRAVEYEQLVANPDAVIGCIFRWLGLPQAPVDEMPGTAAISGIATASLWQARQSVNARSVGRWRHYAACIPELLRFPEHP